MIINLKQAEIEAAIKLYVGQLGINLSGKVVDIAFTAGRKESGLSAELNIEDGAVPGYTDSAKLSSVTPSQPQQANAAVIQLQAKSVESGPSQLSAEAHPEPGPEEPEATGTVAKVSLFT